MAAAATRPMMMARVFPDSSDEHWQRINSIILFTKNQTNLIKIFTWYRAVFDCAPIQQQLCAKYGVKGFKATQKAEKAVQYTTTETQWDTRDILWGASDSNDTKLDHLVPLCDTLPASEHG